MNSKLLLVSIKNAFTHFELQLFSRISCTMPSNCSVTLGKFKMEIWSSILLVAFQLKFLIPFRIQCTFRNISFSEGRERITVKKYRCRAVLKQNNQDECVTKVSDLQNFKKILNSKFQANFV
jgi:plasmid replication initiation protein